MRFQTPTSTHLDFRGCLQVNSSICPNRRMRTRLSGGVAGEERRLSPLCRLRSGELKGRDRLLCGSCVHNAARENTKSYLFNPRSCHPLLSTAPSPTIRLWVGNAQRHHGCAWPVRFAVLAGLSSNLTRPIQMEKDTVRGVRRGTDC